MDATELLARQHERILALFAQYARAGTEEKRRAFLELADLLSAHEAVEEKLFFPAVYDPGTATTLRQAVQEHLDEKRMLIELLDGEAGSAGFEERLEALRRDFERHRLREERDLFPRVRDAYHPDDLQLLGTEMGALFRELKGGEARRTLPQEAERPAALD